jgi:hypothetical protein
MVGRNRQNRGEIANCCRAGLFERRFISWLYENGACVRCSKGAQGSCPFGRFLPNELAAPPGAAFFSTGAARRVTQNGEVLHVAGQTPQGGRQSPRMGSAGAVVVPALRNLSRQTSKAPHIPCVQGLGQNSRFLKDFRTIRGLAGVEEQRVEIDDLGALFLPKLWGL